MDDSLGKNDPNRAVLDSEREGIRPGFLGGSGGGEAPAGLNDDKKKKEREKVELAQDELRNAEDEAGAANTEESGFYRPLDGIKNMRNEEEKAGGFYSGKGINLGKQEGKGKKKRFSLKKTGPIFAIFGALFGVGGLMGGVQGMMPVAIQELIVEKFNSVGISSSMTSDAWLDAQLNNSFSLQYLPLENQGDSSSNVKMFGFSDYQKKEFAGHGIYVYDNIGSDTTKITAMLYKKDNMYIPVVGSDILNNDSYSTDTLVGAISAATGHSNVGTPISVSEAMADSNFKIPYTAASKTWRGGSSGWFDNIMSGVTEIKLGVSRNRWVRFGTRTAKDLAKDFKEIAKSANLSKTSDKGVDAKEYTPEVVEDGKVVQERSADTQITKVKVEQNDSDEVLEEVNVVNTSVNGGGALESVSRVLNSKAVKAAAGAAVASCAILEGLTSVYAVVSAYQSMQFLNVTSGFLESVSKVKAGGGSDSPVHEYANSLTTSGAVTTVGEDGKEYVASGKSNTTAMQSAGMDWLFNNSTVSKDDPSVRNVNFENIMSNTSTLFKDMKTVTELYETCGYVKAGAAALDLASTIISFIPIVGQGIKVAQLSAKAIVKVAIKVAVQVAFYVAIPIAAKNLANMLIKDAATEWFGEDLGNALVSGANKYLGGNGTSGGQSPGSASKVAAYLNARDTVIAEEAEYQRMTRSPFDITSQYTFLGSLAYTLIPLAYSGGGIVSALTDVSNLTSSAVVGMLPTATAINEQSVLSSTGDCLLLGSTGAVGDAFCNPYIITDTSTVGLTYNEVLAIVQNGGIGGEIASTSWPSGTMNLNFDENGKIKKSSNLAKYVTYCGQRTSQYGLKDAIIAEKLTSNTALKIMDSVPVLNDISAIVEGLGDEANLAWSNGKACVASSENDKWENEFKYYQRYGENERLLENMNPDYKSPVTAFLEEQAIEDPIDQSFEGTLARFSGMTKEKVEDTLALIEYYQFVEEYKPSERYAFGTSEKVGNDEPMFDNENVLSGDVVLLNMISFADVRNRTFAI